MKENSVECQFLVLALLEASNLEKFTLSIDCEVRSIFNLWGWPKSAFSFFHMMAVVVLSGL